MCWRLGSGHWGEIQWLGCRITRDRERRGCRLLNLPFGPNRRSFYQVLWSYKFLKISGAGRLYSPCWKRRDWFGRCSIAVRIRDMMQFPYIIRGRRRRCIMSRRRVCSSWVDYVFHDIDISCKLSVLLSYRFFLGCTDNSFWDCIWRFWFNEVRCWRLLRWSCPSGHWDTCLMRYVLHWYCWQYRLWDFSMQGVPSSSWTCGIYSMYLLTISRLTSRWAFWHYLYHSGVYACTALS